MVGGSNPSTPAPAVLSGYLSILRPTNAVVSGLIGPFAYLVAGGEPGPIIAWLFLCVFFVTGAGNAANDLFDVAIDRVNRPDRPIPSGRVSEAGALRYAALLSILGCLAAVPAGALPLLVAAGNTGLLWLYAAHLKKIALAGHLAVAYLSASVFLFGGVAAGLDRFGVLLPLALITFLGTVARELLKAAEDVEGDRDGGARTFPVRFGIRTTVRLAFALALAGIAASFLPYPAWGLPYLVFITPADLLILGGVLRAVRCQTGTCVLECRAATLLKAGMFVALAAFAVAAVLAQS